MKTGGGPYVGQSNDWDEKVASVSAATFNPLENDFDSDASYCQLLSASAELEKFNLKIILNLHQITIILLSKVTVKPVVYLVLCLGVYVYCLLTNHLPSHNEE